MSNRQYQVRSIGTQDLTFEVVVGNSDMQAILRNSQAIFRLAGSRADRLPDGNWSVSVTFTPDNGMMGIKEFTDANPISGNSFPEM